MLTQVGNQSVSFWHGNSQFLPGGCLPNAIRLFRFRRIARLRLRTLIAAKEQSKTYQRFGPVARVLNGHNQLDQFSWIAVILATSGAKR
jgi:hypothetical protein